MNHDFNNSASALTALIRCAINELHRAGKGRPVFQIKRAGDNGALPGRGQLKSFRHNLTNGDNANGNS